MDDGLLGTFTRTGNRRLIPSAFESLKQIPGNTQGCSISEDEIDHDHFWQSPGRSSMIRFANRRETFIAYWKVTRPRGKNASYQIE